MNGTFASNNEIPGVGAVRLLGIAGIVGASSLLAALTAMHFLRPEFNYVAEYVSNYANGPYGFLFALSLLVHGIGNAAMAVGLGYILSDRWGKTGAVLFGLAAVGIILGGLFSTDPGGSTRTVFGTIHAAAALVAFPIEILALLFLRRSFSLTSRWKSFTSTTDVVAAISAAGFLMVLALLNFWTLPGLVERAVSTPLLVWEFFVGFRLARYS